jgi:hypothetical protein
LCKLGCSLEHQVWLSFAAVHTVCGLQELTVHLGHRDTLILS